MNSKTVTGGPFIRWVGTALIVVPAVLVVAVGFQYAEAFQKLFSDFNVELPPLTRFTYDWYPWTLASVVLMAPLIWLTNSDSKEGKARIPVWSGLVVAYAVYVFWLLIMGVGLYLPFFKVSQVQ